MKCLSPEEIVGLGILQESNRTLYHLIGLALELDEGTGTLRLQDHRDDMEGLIFSDPPDRGKYERFVDFAMPRIQARQAAGFLEQPIPDEVEKQEVKDAPKKSAKSNLRLVSTAASQSATTLTGPFGMAALHNLAVKCAQASTASVKNVPAAFPNGKKPQRLKVSR